MSIFYRARGEVEDEAQEKRKGRRQHRTRQHVQKTNPDYDTDAATFLSRFPQFTLHSTCGDFIISAQKPLHYFHHHHHQQEASPVLSHKHVIQSQTQTYFQLNGYYSDVVV